MHKVNWKLYKTETNEQSEALKGGVGGGGDVKGCLRVDSITNKMLFRYKREREGGNTIFMFDMVVAWAVVGRWCLATCLNALLLSLFALLFQTGPAHGL